MAFYIKPPHGTIDLQKLEIVARTRLEFLLRVQGCKGYTIMMKDLVGDASTAKGSDCLIEGSRKDSISHFLLRLALAGHLETRNFFLQSEIHLFHYRLSCMTADEIYSCVKPLRKLHHHLHTTHNLNSRNGNGTFNSMASLSPELLAVLKIIEAIRARYSWDDLIKHYAEGSKHHWICLPFHYVPSLVAKRLVAVHKGIAHVPCSKLLDVLTVIFEKILVFGLRVAERQAKKMVEDCRILNMKKFLMAIFRKKFSPCGKATLPSISCEEVDMLAQRFPLCMQKLHQKLRETHRLRHHDRVQYTLFLKEIGLPVHEAIQFWRQEYSQPSSGSNGCTHSWQKDGRRYTYSIRHLYGLEGSCTNYRGHSCHTIQNRSLASGECGGCPYMLHDPANPDAIFSKLPIPDAVRQGIIAMAMDNEAQRACRLHLLASVWHKMPPDFLNRIREERTKISEVDPFSHKVQNVQYHSPDLEDLSPNLPDFGSGCAQGASSNRNKNDDKCVRQDGIPFCNVNHDGYEPAQEPCDGANVQMKTNTDTGYSEPISEGNCDCEKKCLKTKRKSDAERTSEHSFSELRNDSQFRNKDGFVSKGTTNIKFDTKTSLRLDKKCTSSNVIAARENECHMMEESTIYQKRKLVAVSYESDSDMECGDTFKSRKSLKTSDYRDNRQANLAGSPIDFATDDFNNNLKMEVCHSSQSDEQTSDMETDSKSGSSDNDHEQCLDIVIRTPLNFFTSYSKLLDGLNLASDIASASP